MPTVKKHNNQGAVTQRTVEETTQQHRGAKRANHSCGKNNQLQRSILLYKNARNLSILSPDEDWQYAVETLRCTS